MKWKEKELPDSTDSFDNYSPETMVGWLSIWSKSEAFFLHLIEEAKTASEGGPGFFRETFAQLFSDDLDSGTESFLQMNTPSG